MLRGGSRHRRGRRFLAFQSRLVRVVVVSTLSATELRHVFVGYRTKLERLLQRRLQSRDTAQDLAQDTYLKLLRVAEQFPSEDDARRYLVRMALNAATDHQRSEGRRAELLAGAVDLFDQSQLTPEDAALAGDELRQLEQVLADLPSKCRDVLYLSRVEGMTHAEIATALGVSKSLVDKYAVRALQHCRERLKQRG
jgi:RNA polymerase sigma factor (sigma-70 family)